MNNLVSLGYGFYDLENDFRWTQDKFCITVSSKQVSSIQLLVRCNKLYSDYCLYFSTDNWDTTEKFNLNDGVNTIIIPIQKPCDIKFNCSSFIPVNIGMGDDGRTLGIQLIKISVKNNENKDLQEILIKDTEIKNSDFPDTEFNIDELIKCVTLKSGWHELELQKLRWSNGNGEVIVKSEGFQFLKLRIFSRKNQIMRVIINDFTERSEKLSTGFNEVVFDTKELKKINLITNTFSPKEDEVGSEDSRKLGIQLHGVILVGENDTKYVPMKNVFFEHDVDPLYSFVKKFAFKNENIKEVGSLGDVMVGNFKHYDDGKLNMNNQLIYYSHRCGWGYVVNSMLKYHNDKGVKFTGFLEKHFLWKRREHEESGEIPYKEPWVGFMHSPWSFPSLEKNTGQDMIKFPLFQASLKTCKGIYVLSKDLMEQLKNEVNVPVNHLYYPTDFIENIFSVDKFNNNNEKQVIEVGSWLRKTNSLFMLNVDKKIWKKIKLVPTSFNFEKILQQIKFEREKYKLIVTKSMQESVKYIPQISDEGYDELLSKNVVFCDLFATSANTIIIECIARGTPILINPLPAVVEYLGEEYPFYFKTMEEASEKINNFKLIEDTHYYLMNSPNREFIRKDKFLKDFENSEIYRSL